MLEALETAHVEHRSSTDDLLRVLVHQTRLVARQLIASAGGKDPGPLDLPVPGEQKPKKSNGLASLAKALRRKG